MNQRALACIIGVFFALVASATDAAVVLTYPQPGTQYVPANPGGSATMVVRLTNNGSAASAPLTVFGDFYEDAAETFTYTSLDPVNCVFTRYASGPPFSLTVPSIAAGVTLSCSIRIDRPPTALVDGALGWGSPSGPLPGTVVIGERVAISAQAQTLSKSGNGQPATYRVRVTTTNDGNVALTGVRFYTCGLFSITSPSVGGCPLTPPLDLPACTPAKNAIYFASPMLPAGGTASCEIDVHIYNGAAGFGGFAREYRLRTQDGRTVFDSAQEDADVPLLVSLGIPSMAVPALGTYALMMLAGLLALIAVWRRPNAITTHR